jgi:hypothetical protein
MTTDPLASWNDGAAKGAIVAFVERMTRKSGSGFVPEAEWIAVFDNDETLWPEAPLPGGVRLRRTRGANTGVETRRVATASNSGLTRPRFRVRTRDSSCTHHLAQAQEIEHGRSRRTCVSRPGPCGR